MGVLGASNDAKPVPLQSSFAGSRDPIDLSMSVLRSVSPIHVEYLHNMGVGASLSISIIVGGKLGDIFGRRLVFAAGTILILVGSVIAGLAQGAPMLIAGRLVEGVGAAAILPSALAIVAVSFSGRERDAFEASSVRSPSATRRVVTSTRLPGS